MPLEAVKHISDDEAVRRINRYFELQSNCRPLYSGSRFDTFAGGGCAAPNQITPADLIAVSMLSVHVPAQAAIGITGKHASEIEELLSRIPTDIRLESLGEFEPLLGQQSASQKLWDLLRQNRGTRWGVGPTTASKILARKRPQLIPVFDAVVSDARKGKRSGNHWCDWFDAFRAPENLLQIRRLQDFRTETGQQHLSLLRVLDIVLWMHGRGGHEVEERVDDDEF